MNMGTLQLWAWPASALSATFVGLAAMGFNILTMLNVPSLRKPLQYLAGAAGTIALCVYCCNKLDPILKTIHATDSTFNLLVWMITAITAFCVGLAALGCDLSKSLHLGPSRKTLQYLAGAAGIYSLILYYR